MNHSSMQQGGEDAARQFLQRFIIVTILLVPLILLNFISFSFKKYLQFGIATGIFYFALIFFEHARHEIKMRKFGMMTLVSLGVGSGYLFSAASTFMPVFAGTEFYLEISTLVWVLLLGHYLEARSSSAAGDSLAEVAKLLPKQAHLVKGDKLVETDIDKLQKNDIVLVKPGEKVPADGTIISGKANLNESLISGEAKPAERKERGKVIAGSICLDGALKIKLEKVGEDSTIGQIQKLIAQAKETKPSAQKIADKAASILTFTALGVSLFTVFVWSFLVGKPLVFAIPLAITVLVIACPHALGLAIPTVSTIATTLAIKNGIFIKDLAKLEVVKKIGYVVFDKTGTLTQGSFEVVDVSGTDKDNLIKIAASLEKYSSHVIGRAIVKYGEDKKIKFIPVSDFKNIAGKGISGNIGGVNYLVGNATLMKEKNLSNEKKGADTAVYVSDNKRVLGSIVLADKIKRESFSAVEKLHGLGVKVAMLTGDNERVAKTVAEKLGIDTYFARVLPEDKYKYIKSLQPDGNKVMMVGDGVNDAPALTQADVGVAIGAGTDVAVEAGDIVLTRNNPEDIARLIILARKVYRKMVENLLWATGYNVLAIPAAAGLFASWGIFLKPEIGAILMSLSSVIVVANALTLRRDRL